MSKQDDQITTAMLRRLPDPSLIALMAAVATRMEPIGRGLVAAGGPDWEVERRVEQLWGWSEAPNRDAAGDEMVVLMRAEPAQPGPGSSAVERASFALHMVLTGLFIGVYGVDGCRDRELFELVESRANGIRDVYGRTWPWLVPGEQAAQLSDVEVLRSGGRLSAAAVRESAAYQERLQVDQVRWLDLPPFEAPPEADDELDELVEQLEGLLPRLSDRSLVALALVWATACSVEAEFDDESLHAQAEQCLGAVRDWVLSGQAHREHAELFWSFEEAAMAATEDFMPDVDPDEAMTLVQLMHAAADVIVRRDPEGARDELLIVAERGTGLDAAMVDAARQLAKAKVPTATLLDRLTRTVTE